MDWFLCREKREGKIRNGTGPVVEVYYFAFYTGVKEVVMMKGFVQKLSCHGRKKDPQQEEGKKMSYFFGHSQQVKVFS